MNTDDKIPFTISRISVNDMELIKKASDKDRRSIASFFINSAVRNAEQVLKE